MTDPVRRQYEAYPYPARDPAEESQRLITGSPSHPFEIDHFIYGGARDWSRPFRVLFAGGGTGDGLIMLAQMLKDHGISADITYLDLSTASRAIAEARAAARGLENIRFLTGDLMTAPELGPFDYIDCCGVLHHLPDPDAGFAALRAALAEDGGLGAMVYAPYGRDGVYELQAALHALTEGLEPEAQVDTAKRLLSGLPPTHPFARNPFVKDHLAGGDAGLYDLLLHSRDRAFTVPELFAALKRADLGFVSFVAPGRYAPALLLLDQDLRSRAIALPFPERAALAERLCGNIKAHVFYARPGGETPPNPAIPAPEAVPTLLNVPVAKLAESIWQTGMIKAEQDGLGFQRQLPKEAAGILQLVDGQRSLAQIQAKLGWDRQTFDTVFGQLYQPLNNFNLMRFSTLKRG